MPSEILVTVAEVAAAFVGFSMVVGLLSPGSPDSQQRFNAIRDVAEISLITVGGPSFLLLRSSSPSQSRSSGVPVASASLWSGLRVVRPASSVTARSAFPCSGTTPHGTRLLRC